jgi:hypothetical protein
MLFLWAAMEQGSTPNIWAIILVVLPSFTIAAT